MGKLMHNTQMKHSSHPHLLQLSSNSNLHLQQQAAACVGCNLHISPNDEVYNCRPCNFFLHPSCAKFPPLITHPSHREHSHALSLLPTPIYPGGFFRCDACTQQGTRFSYHCHICDFDLHILCASKPLSVNHPFHPPHPLVLTFESPYGEKVGFSCDVCHFVGSSDQWLYRCVSCEFDVHLHCAATKMPILQHNHSFPASASASASANPNQFMVAGQPLSHSMSTGHGHGHVQTYWQPPPPAAAAALQTYQQQMPPPPVAVQSYHMSQQQQQQQQQPPPSSGPGLVNQNVNGNGNGNGLGDAIVTGFVDGMMQQLGQNFVQSLTGGGGDGSVVGDNDYESTTTNTNDDY